MMFEILEKNGINNSKNIISYLEKNKIYFTHSMKEQWENKYKELYLKVDKKWKYKDLNLSMKTLKLIEEFRLKKEKTPGGRGLHPKGTQSFLRLQNFLLRNNHFGCRIISRYLMNR